MLDKRKIGFNYEAIAVNFLVKKGYKIIGRNVSGGGGEIDIIAYFEGEYIFAEVKARSGEDSENIALESFNFTKQQRLVRAVKWYLSRNKINNPFQIDLVTIYQRNHAVYLKHWPNFELNARLIKDLW